MVNFYCNFITCKDEANVSDVAGKKKQKQKTPAWVLVEQ